MATIPRFLLPRRGPMWQQQRTLATQFSPAVRPTTATNSLVARQAQRQRPSGRAAGQRSRHASTRQGKVASSQPRPSPSSSSPPPPAGNILEKPAKFNPPSHGARLPRRNNNNAPASQHYGGDLSAAERQAQRTRQYPGMMAPEGTWSHWFWTSRAFHMTITMSTLTALALFTFFENFRRSSPYVDMLPTLAEATAHPIQAARTAIEVVRLTEHQRVTEIAEKRQQRVDDVSKRTMYRKAHGMDETVGFGSNGGWFSKREGPTAPARNEADQAAAIIVDDASPVRGAAPVGDGAEAGNRKKFWGIF